LKSEFRYSTPFKNAKATNEGESADFANFNPKIGSHGKVHRASASQISQQRSNTYHTVKILWKSVRWILG